MYTVNETVKSDCPEDQVDGAFILAHVPDYLSGAFVTLRFGL